MVAVCGASQATGDDETVAAAVGRLLVERGCNVICGGGPGVAAAVARAVSDAGGTCIGVLPGDDADDAAPGVTVAIPTGLGHVRNTLIARSCDAMIAIGGGYGTLSEIAFALVLGRPVVAVDSWRVIAPGATDADASIHRVSTAEAAVDWVSSRLPG